MGTRERPEVAGDYAHDAPDTTTAFPVKIGGYASTAPGVAVAEGDRVQANFDLQGRQRVLASGMLASDAPHTTTSHPVMLGGLASAVLGVAVGEADAVIANFALDGRQRNIVSGMIAHDGPNTTTSHPVKIGGIAKEHDGTDPGSVAEDDAVDARFDRNGCQYVNMGHPNFWHTSAAFTALQTVTTQFVAAPGAGLSLYITDIIVGSNANSQFFLGYNTTSQTTLFRCFLPAASNFSHSFRTPLKAAAANNLSFSTDASQTSINIVGYIAP